MSQQKGLNRLIRAKYRMQAGFAREGHRPFDAEMFLIGLPRYLHSLSMSASYPEIDDSSDVMLPLFNPAKIPTTPRRSLRHPT